MLDSVRGWREEEKRINTNDCWFKFEGDKNVLKLIVVMAP